MRKLLFILFTLISLAGFSQLGLKHHLGVRVATTVGGAICCTPQIILDSAGSITDTSIVLYATVNPNGESTVVYFEYGTSTAYGDTVNIEIGNITTNQQVTATIEDGLAPYTKYYFRCIAINSCDSVASLADSTTTAIPSILQNAWAWYEYDTIVTKTSGSDSVASWGDKNGISDRTLSNSTVGSQPRWTSDGIVFDGSNDYLRTTVNHGEKAQPITIYAVLDLVTFSYPDYGIRAYQGIYTRFSDAGGGDVIYVIGAGDGGLSTVIPSGYFLSTQVFNGASSSLQLNDNAAMTGNIGTGGFWYTLILFIDSVYTSGATNIKIKALIIFDEAHDAATRSTIKNYLNEKYSIY